MPNNNGKQQNKKKGNGQPVNQLCQMLGKIIAQQNQSRGKGPGKKNRKKNPEKPHFPLATEDDVRHHFTPSERQLCLSSIQTAFNQGAGTCALSDSGRISYTVEFSLPTQHTVRLIRATAPPSV
uniref:Nucleoprotein n=1 Tax=Porcine reproductive and respiratory syndrome virus TaxID=28344 RepID=I7BTQ5_PRRSV|nr:nucleocapsid protein [Porcine reproductive and respiratory syndrome virus]AGL08504.1 nucleocapsid protein [Porcine reproductive and respiratory syndrome virus]